MLVFLAPDSLRLAELEQAVREFLAWRSIVDDGEAGRLNLDAFQRSQAKTQHDSADETVRQRVPETYQWLLVPEQADPLAKVELRQVKVPGGPDPIAKRAAAKLGSEELLITKYGGVNLRLVLTKTLTDYWGEQHEVALRELWSWFTQYPYHAAAAGHLGSRGRRRGRCLEPVLAHPDLRLRGSPGDERRVPLDRGRPSG